MDIKNRVKSVKEKLKELGYEVKHTHCQEVLAVAHGERNFHTLKAKEEGPSNLSKALDIILPEQNKEFVMAMNCSSIREEFEGECRAVLVSLSPKDYEKIIKAYDLVEKGIVDDFGINLSKDSNIRAIDPRLHADEVYDNDFIWVKTDNFNYIFEENEGSSAEFKINVNKHGLWVFGESNAFAEQRLTFDSKDCISIAQLKGL